MLYIILSEIIYPNSARIKFSGVRAGVDVGRVPALTDLGAQFILIKPFVLFVRDSFKIIKQFLVVAKRFQITSNLHVIFFSPAQFF